MPTISSFYGVIIKMYFQQSEHNPPHIHAVYGEYIGEIDILTGKMLEGDLPVRALKMVQEWIECSWLIKKRIKITKRTAASIPYSKRNQMTRKQ